MDVTGGKRKVMDANSRNGPRVATEAAPEGRSLARGERSRRRTSDGRSTGPEVK